VIGTVENCCLAFHIDNFDVFSAENIRYVHDTNFEKVTLLPEHVSAMSFEQTNVFSRYKIKMDLKMKKLSI